MKTEWTQKLVREIFTYHEDGYLTWNISFNRKINIGDRAGNVYLNKINNTTYHILGLFGCRYRVARLIFLYHKGYLPKIVDHENRNSLDDRIDNLREATSSQNNANKQKSKKQKSSKYLGVYFDSFTKRWACSTSKNGKIIHGKRFDTEPEAALAYNKMAVMHHGEFANLNIINNQL